MTAAVVLALTLLVALVWRRRSGATRVHRDGKQLLTQGSDHFARGETRAAIRCFQEVMVIDRSLRNEAQARLIPPLLALGHGRLAVEEVSALDTAALPTDLVYDLAIALEGAGCRPASVQLLVQIHQRDSGFRNVAAKLAQEIESGGGKVPGGGSAPSPLDGIPTRYTDLQPINRGGMGVVLSARDALLDRRVAIKMLAPELIGDPEFAKRFRREAQALAKVSHPNVVQIFDVHLDEVPFFTMEYLDGVSLDAELRRRAFDLEEALSIALQVAEALSCLNSHGLVHRDVKPENIILLPSKQAKLVDLGLVRSVNWSLMTQKNIPVGTPRYMAPEQVRGSEADGRSDLFSLGIVLFELLSGAHPFDDVDGKPHPPFERAPALRSRIPDISSALDGLVYACTDPVAEHRPQTASAVVQVLTEELASVRRRRSSSSRESLAAALSALRDLHSEILHPLKGVLGILGRAADNPDKIMEVFFSPGNISRLERQLDAELPALLSALGSSRPTGIGPVDGAAALLASAGLPGLFRAIVRARSDPSQRATDVLPLLERMRTAVLEVSARWGALFEAHRVLIGPCLAAGVSAFGLREQVRLRLADDTVAMWVVDRDTASRALAAVLDAVLTNAFEAGASRVELDLTRDEAAGEAALAISDDGPGFPPAVLARAFTPGLTTKPEGTGTGLTRARELILSLGGRLSVANSAAGHASVAVRLPLA